jgi:hypothetical protein
MVAKVIFSQFVPYGLQEVIPSTVNLAADPIGHKVRELL